MKASCIQNLNIDGAEFLTGTVYDFEIEVINDDTPIQGVTLARGTKHRHYRFCAIVICLIAGRPVPTRIPFYDHQYVELHPQDELGTYNLPFDAYFKALEEVKDADHIIYPNFKPSFEEVEKWKHKVLNYPKPCKKLTIEVEMTYPQSEEVSTNDTMEIMRSYFQEWLNKVFAGGQDLFRFSRLKVINDNQTLEIQ